ncbi:hypothetical protein [Fredinandcohnia quinoae]|uniref:Uncharacterized protein n=1 Tax=Fredinandcohnia quinoae TaxID=2918902 RepID=A0AAW5E796_9BACI|nr:hypothetical protein [Fredinandcohnia sp. SECRCQ15]MCH1625495.1 hypothetical protein [Fredinandcohnia sp. SECRCQ15]
MLLYNILYLFLYFPEDKSEYIPAAITSIIFIIFTILATRFFIKHSKKEAEKTRELEEKIMNNENENL